MTKNYAYCLLMCLLTACASPSPRYYALAVPPLAASAPSTTAPSLMIAAVTVPERIDRPQLVLRRADTRFDVLEDDRWLETPKHEIPRVIAAHLATHLPYMHVAAYPQNAGNVAMYQLLLDIQTFDAQPGEAVTIALTYTLRRESDGQRTTWQIRDTEPLLDAAPASIVAAWSQVLGRMAAQMAVKMRRVVGVKAMKKMGNYSDKEGQDF
jgi:uncharacterized protein